MNLLAGREDEHRREEKDVPLPLAEPSTIWLSVEEWIEVLDNPHQRDTVRHLQQAVHLSRRSPAHMHVIAALLPDGSLMKVDGHTRALLWDIAPATAPPRVMVTVYPVGTVEEAGELYHHFDNSSAVDTAYDDLSGAFRRAGFEPKSQLLRTYRGTYGVKLATLVAIGYPARWPVMSVYDLVPLWIDELRAVDELRATQRRFPSSFVAAALLSVLRRGPVAAGVWARYQADEGEKRGREFDGVQALAQLIASGAPHGGQVEQLRLCAKALACVEAAVSGRALTAQPRAVKLDTYIQGMKLKTRRFEGVARAFLDDFNMRVSNRAEIRKLIMRATSRLH
jgi:hypothetical protein